MSNPTTVRKIALGADHAGFELKQHVLQHLRKQGLEVVDCGTHGPDPVDYPQFAAAVARQVADGGCPRGIVIDGAGIGSCMAANKVAGVRAALCHDVSSARNSREHNDANVLTLGAGMVGRSLAEQIVDAWLAGECTADRHRRRVEMIGQIERGAPTAEPTRTTGVEGLSEEDLARVVARMAELRGATGAASCTEASCMFCRVCGETDPKRIRQLIDAGAHRIGHRPGQGSPPRELAQYIDHTLLRPDATAEDVRKLCVEAREYSFASVCLNPTYVKLAARELAGTPVKVCAVVGFPLGAHVADVKAMEARRAIREGATEIDMVINLGALKSGECDLVYRDILAVTDACIERRVVCKVIIETALLTDDEKAVACRLARKARADYVKTSTGFGPGGATAHDVALMAEAVRGTTMGVKASGGIRTLADARKLIEAGATRIGASASVKIMAEAQKEVTVSA